MNETTLFVRHIGPIEEVRLDVRRINLFLGPQSSGKSTLAKILSQALWAEKNFLTMGEQPDFFKELMAFHNMDRTYFSDKTLEVVYDSSWCKITMRYEEEKRRNPQSSYEKKNSRALYHNIKIEYIPAERNFVSSIANIRKYSETYNSLVSFLEDWSAAKERYQNGRLFPIKLNDLTFSYRYIESSKQDWVRLENEKEVRLQSASSGQQSILPLLIVTEEVMKKVYAKQKVFSPEEQAHIRRLTPDESMAAVVDVIGAMNKQTRTKEVVERLNELWKKLGYIGDYGGTHLVIEEPEQNLYPSTQRGLLQHLVSLLTDGKARNHTLTLTTHSPFILYALDNCMLAGMAVDRGKAEKLDAATRASAISPHDVGLWLLRDGGIISLQDDKDHLLNKDLFNDEFQENNERIFQLLNILENKKA